MEKIKVGFLPLYVKMYDDVNPNRKKPMMDYMEAAVKMLETCNISVQRAPVCRVEEEFIEAVESFNREDVSAVITLHLAYSPSLESIEAFKLLKMPIIILDSTVVYDFGDRMDPTDISHNHGIHGVQDMCCMLKRTRIPYYIEAGHILHSDVIARVASLARAAAAAKALKDARVGLIGKPYSGMGDFRVPHEKLIEDIVSDVISFDFLRSDYYLNSVKEAEIKEETQFDAEHFSVEIKDEKTYIQATKAGLAIRRWVEENELSAYTLSFPDITKECGLGKLPFAELSKSMMHGVGYAGEGDTLTAALTGALLSVYKDVSFTEMFCPDWKNGYIFLSHMGEMNLALSSYRPVLCDKAFPFVPSGDTVSAYGCFRGGKACFLSLAPDADGYTLVIAPVEMLDKGHEFSSFRYTTEGWMKPEIPINDFLKRYSIAGGTHHGVIVYGVSPEELSVFGEIMNFKVVYIK